MKQKQRYIKTMAGLQIQSLIFLTGLITAYGYAWMSHTKINDVFIVAMLRSFIVFADLGLFLAIGYLIDFKRGVVIGYIYKVLAFLQIDEMDTISQMDFVFKTIGKAFALVLYYKITLFLIIFTSSYVVEMDHEDDIVKKRQIQEEQDRLIKEQKQEQQKMFSSVERQQLYGMKNSSQEQKSQKTQTQKTITRIKLSLRYHKQQEFYKKIQIFFFIFFNSVCILTLFPLQEYVLDFSKALQLGERIDFFQHAQNLRAVNRQIIWYMNFQTVWNVVMFWLIILLGEFKIKSAYPALIKQYILGVPAKFLLIQVLSLAMLLIVLATTPISQAGKQLNTITLLSMVNWQIFGVAYLIHTLLPLFISFLLLRLYLGQTCYLNHLVSKKFSFHKNDEDGNSNLDVNLYQCVIQDDINRVKHFIIDPIQLLSRYKLKRYTEEDKLKHYVDQKTILEIQSLFEDHMVLDLYNKLSRFIVVGMFYITLGVFLVSLNINDTYFVTQDKFFVHMPAILLCLGLFFLYKYESTVNVFYPKLLGWMVKKWSQWLAQKKAYNFIRLTHFYAIIFTIWLYRIYSEIFLPTHTSVQEQIKSTLYDYYSSQSFYHTSLMSSLLSGWSEYYTTHSSGCNYNILNLVIESIMIFLMTFQVLSLRYYSERKSKGDNPFLLILKLLTPLYAFFVFVVNMECLEWGSVIFCCSVGLGVMFISVNSKELERGIIRNDEGEYE